MTAAGDQLGIGLPGDGRDAETSGGTVVYTDAAPSAATAVQATEEGGVRVLVTIADATAAHDYRFPLDLPEGATPTLLDSGEVVLPGAAGEDLSSIAPPWAKDADGLLLPTSYSLDGTTLVQHVAFDQSTAFPVVIDPWWNPFSWHWSRIGHATLNGLKKCGLGAAYAIVGTGAATVTTNIIRNAVGQTMIKVAGGPWGYVGLGVGGCVVKLIGG